MFYFFSMKNFFVNKKQKQPLASTCSGICNFIKKKLQHRYFQVNFAKLLKTLFLQNKTGRLLLKKEIAAEKRYRQCRSPPFARRGLKKVFSVFEV